MGYRTVVLLQNDRASEWQKDAELGHKIAIAMNYAMPMRLEPGDRSKADFGYGHVVSCHHADTQSIGIFDSYHFTPLAYSNWYAGEDEESMKLKMLKVAAEEMGYRLVKKANKHVVKTGN